MDNNENCKDAAVCCFECFDSLYVVTELLVACANIELHETSKSLSHSISLRRCLKNNNET